jgi:uncharacterized membrane protein YfcA
MSFEPTAGNLIYIAAVFLLAGVVKGVLGIGMPLVSVPLLATILGPITAMTLLAVPTFAINFAQTVQSGYMKGAFRRFWTAYPLLIIGVIVSVSLFLTRMDRGLLMAIVGVVVILIAISQFLPFAITIPERSERWCTPLVGAVSGLVGGVTSFLGPLMVMYLVALRVDKDQFVGAIALFYMIASVPFYVGLGVSGYLGWPEFWASCGAAVMIWLGVMVGQKLRARASGDLFRRLVLGMLILIGANMIRKGLM